MPTLAVAHIDVINPWLSELSVSTGTLTPEFNSTIYYYTVDVDYSVTEITISATPFQWDAIVTGIGTHSLSVGTNIFTVTVVAAGATTDYQITVNRAAASTDATLINLTISDGTLTPIFNSNTYNYTVDVEYSVVEITITGTATDPNATVVGNGLKPIDVGENTFSITVTAQDGVTTLNYTVTVNRAYNDDATLMSLTVLPGTLTPIFNSNTYNYTVEVEYSVTEITITGTATDPNATVVGNGLKPIDVGENTFTITVTAQDGVTTLNYTVTVNRAYNDDATLMSLTVSDGTLTPVFNSNTYNYTVDVEYSVTEITITGTATDPNATVVGNGLKPLDVGENTFTITVTAQDGVTTLNYTVTVNRADNIGITEIVVGKIKIYPNPTTGELRIENGEWRMENVEIFDIYGKKVFEEKGERNKEQGDGKIVINIGDLPAGVYFLRLKNEVVKIVKL
ncbi:MAG: cadherin-like beta sandwich domain-containing protein [Lentimicrobiaceae bacterium]|nr:cadherin-like beta sandwich domain-containing protein [Lentimicrobiaceae bacterium]